MKVISKREFQSSSILVASSSSSATGMNIKNIYNIIFAHSYRSHNRNLQSLGRGLRVHEGKEQLNVYDLVDDLYENRKTRKKKLNALMRQFIYRLKIYRKEGFEVVTKTFNLRSRS